MKPNWTNISVTLSTIIAMIAFLDGDWMWFIINALCVCLLLFPTMKRTGYRYLDAHVKATLVAPVGAICLWILGLAIPLGGGSILDVSAYTYLTAAIQAYQGFFIGLMAAIIMDRSYGLTMTPAWMGIFSLTFAMSLSTVDMVYMFGELHAQGYPVFDGDFFHEKVYTNAVIMTAPMTSMVVTTLMTILFVRKTYRMDRDQLIILNGTSTATEVPRIEPSVTRMTMISDDVVPGSSHIDVYDLFALIMGIVTMVLGIHTLEVDHHSATRCIVTSLLCFVLCILKVLRIVHLPGPLTMLISIAVSLHGIGLITGAYDDIVIYDTITHSISSAVVAIIVFYALIIFQYYGNERINFTGTGLAVLSGLIAMTFSVYWEVFEYVADVITSSMTQYSPYDTIMDIVCDGVGVTFASLWVRGQLMRHTGEELALSFQLTYALRCLATAGIERE